MLHRFLSGMLVACALYAPATGIAQSSAAPDRVAIEAIIREYLLKNPELLIEAMQELEKKQTAMKQAVADRAIVERREEIFNDPDTPVGGNPKGDVTIVEFFDYNCGYCKQVHPVVTALLAQDDRIRLLYKEMPILSDNSRFVALAALAAGKQGKYRELHNALMEERNQVTRERLMQIAAGLKIDAKRLAKDMEEPQLMMHLARNLDLARALNVTGTPGFLVGNKVVPGAMDLATMKRLVTEARGG